VKRLSVPMFAPRPQPRGIFGVIGILGIHTKLQPFKPPFSHTTPVGGKMKQRFSSLDVKVSVLITKEIIMYSQRSGHRTRTKLDTRIPPHLQHLRSFLSHLPPKIPKARPQRIPNSRLWIPVPSYLFCAHHRCRTLSLCPAITKEFEIAPTYIGNASRHR
jgi:hypothetical protein